jgi:hypothetical protein
LRLESSNVGCGRTPGTTGGLGLAESGTAARWSKEHLIGFVEIAFISILSRRLKRLVVKELSA